jgi:uncharacterized protein (TIRG00374 family)
LKKSVLKTLRYLLFLGLALLLLFFAFKGIDLKILWNNLVHARYGWVAVPLLFASLAYFSRAYRWSLLIEPLGYKPKLKNTFTSMMVGYLANYAFPRIGEITRCGVLARTEKIPADKLFGTVIIERLIDMLMVFILLFILLIGRFEFFGSFLKENILIPVWNMLTGITEKSFVFWLVVILAGLSFIILFYLLLRARPDSNPIILRIRKIIKGMISGIQTVYKMKHSWSFVLHSLVIWGSYWLMSYFAVFILPATSGLKPIDGLFILVIGSFGFIAPVQGGIGAFHWIVSVGLTIYGISKEEGLAFATLLHGAQSLWTIFLGTVSMLLLFLNRKKTAAINT